MRIARRIGLVLVAVCAFSALAVSSASASPTFLAHLWTKILPLAEAESAQTFVAPAAAGPITCKKVKLLSPDIPPGLQFLSILVRLDYESCEAFGLGALVHPVQYIIDANGLVILDNTVRILVPALGCTVVIPQAKNASLNTIKFDNRADGSLLLLSKVTGITSFGEGAGCTYAEESKGTYEGNVRVFADGPAGSVLRWDP